MRSSSKQIASRTRRQSSAGRVWAFLGRPLHGADIEYPQSFVARWPEEKHAVKCPDCGYDLMRLTSNRCPECGSEFDRTTIITNDYLRNDGLVADVIGTPQLRRLNLWYGRVVYVWIAATLAAFGITYTFQAIFVPSALKLGMTGEALEVAIRHKLNLEQVLRYIWIGALIACAVIRWWIRRMRRRAIRKTVSEI